MWEEIKRMITKTLCSIQPILAHQYRSCQYEDYYNHMCFEILGLDIIIDHKGKPYLLEVNHTPSFSTDTPLDHNLKASVIEDSIKLMNVSAEARSSILRKKKEKVEARMKTGKREKMTPEQRKTLAEDCQRERDRHIASHLANFYSVYPDPSGVEPEPYEEFIGFAKKCFEESTGASNPLTEILDE
jgi:tubulin polyglutamylase TTLL6/13